MFVYALLKGVRLNYLDASFRDIAVRGYKGILSQFVEYDEKKMVNVHGACVTAGLGGNPYRDGSYNYYINTKIRSNDPKAVGPFILASLEIEYLGETL